MEALKSEKPRKTWVFSPLALISAVAASSCCWLPLLFLGLGISGFSVGAAVDKFRPLLGTSTFGFLGLAFFFAYRPEKRKKDETIGDSCSGPACAPEDKGRLSLKKINRIGLWIVAILAALFFFFPKYSGLLFASESKSMVADSSLSHVTLNIQGMTCEGCAGHVKQALLKLPGVHSAEVSYEKGKAEVRFAATQVTGKTLEKAVKEVGYQVLETNEEKK